MIPAFQLGYIILKQAAFSNIDNGPRLNAQWIYNTPVHSDVEAKLRNLLVDLGNANKILGIQVHICGYIDIGHNSLRFNFSVISSGSLSYCTQL